MAFCLCINILQVLIFVGLIQGKPKAFDGGPLQSSSQLWWRGNDPLIPRYKDTPTNITSLVGDSAFLPCSVAHLGDRSVTWMRQRDLHILTAGVFTYSADERFRVLHPENTDDWTLQIRYVTFRDSGVYECQVNSDPKVSHAVTLTVKEHNQLDDPGMFMESTDTRFPNYIFEEVKEPIKKSQKRKKGRRKGAKRKAPIMSIEGPRKRYIQQGSVLELTCVVHHPPRRGPKDLSWYHNDEHYNYNSKRGGVSTHTEKVARKTVSKLIMSAVHPRDSGEYLCTAEALEPVGVTVHVQEGQFSAAVHQSGVSGSEPRCIARNLAVILIFLGHSQLVKMASF